MKKQNLYERVGKTVLFFQKIDIYLSFAISQYYIKQINIDFYQDVLGPLNFKSKLGIIRKIISKKKITFHFSEAERFSEIRNIIIHNQGFDRNIFFLKKGERRHKIESLFDEFENIGKILDDDIFELLKSLGTNMTQSNTEKTEDDSYEFPIWNFESKSN